MTKPDTPIDLGALQREKADAWRAYLRADRAWHRAGDRWTAAINRFNQAVQAPKNAGAEESR